MTIPRLFAFAAAAATLLLLPGGAVATDAVIPFSGTIPVAADGVTASCAPADGAEAANLALAAGQFACVAADTSFAMSRAIRMAFSSNIGRSTLRAPARIHLGRSLHPCDRIDYPGPPGQDQLFLFRFQIVDVTFSRASFVLAQESRRVTAPQSPWGKAPVPLPESARAAWRGYRRPAPAQSAAQ